MKKGFSYSVREGHVRPAAPYPVTRPPPRRLLAATAGLFLLIFGLASSASADERPEILNILSQFVASSTAAARGPRRFASDFARSNCTSKRRVEPLGDLDTEVPKGLTPYDS